MGSRPEGARAQTGRSGTSTCPGASNVHTLYVLAIALWVLSMPASSSAAHIVLSTGEEIEALSAEPMPFDMVRVTMIDRTYRYVTTVRIRSVTDDLGRDQTNALVRDRERVGTPLGPGLRVPGPGLRVGPRSVTDQFAITETTLLGRIAGDGTDAASFEFDMGLMWNVADSSALGGTVFLGTGGQFDANVGGRLRYRRWLSRTASVDVAPGIAWGRDMSYGTAVPPTYSMQVSMNPSRYVSLTAEVLTAQHHRYGYRDSRWGVEEFRETGLMAGIRIGQWPGAVVGVLPILTTLFASMGTSTEMTRPIP